MPPRSTTVAYWLRLQYLYPVDGGRFNYWQTLPACKRKFPLRSRTHEEILLSVRIDLMCPLGGCIPLISLSQSIPFFEHARPKTSSDIGEHVTDRSGKRDHPERSRSSHADVGNLSPTYFIFPFISPPSVYESLGGMLTLCSLHPWGGFSLSIMEESKSSWFCTVFVPWSN